MVTNYRKGADFERRVKKFLEKKGFFVVRSAGSHSPVDLVAVMFGLAYLIQCKSGSGKMSKKEIEKFDKLCKDLWCCGYIAVVEDGEIVFRLISNIEGKEVTALEASIEKQDL